MTSIRLPLLAPNPLWSIARGLGVVLTVVLLVALVLWPGPALKLVWDAVIPILPAVFLISPMVWRNVCPLATLNELTGKWDRGHSIDGGALTLFWTVGLVLLAILVPARRFFFNENGVAMAATVAAVGIIAVTGGIYVSRRGGFCNSLCPVLPVEKLYGQGALLTVGSSRCGDCNQCTATACIDLAGRKSARQSTIGGRGWRWLVTPYGIFAAAFPGFIVGYFTTENGPPSTAWQVYRHVFGWALASYAGLGVVVAATRPRVSLALLLLGALAVSLYYWYAAPSLGVTYGAPVLGSYVVRGVALALVGAWLTNALRRGMV